MSITVNNYLDTKGYSKVERNEILDTWRKRAKQIGGIPQF